MSSKRYNAEAIMHKVREASVNPGEKLDHGIGWIL